MFTKLEYDIKSNNTGQANDTISEQIIPVPSR